MRNNRGIIGGGGEGATWEGWEEQSDSGWQISFPGVQMDESWIPFAEYWSQWRPDMSGTYACYRSAAFGIPLINVRPDQPGGVYDADIGWAWAYHPETGSLPVQPAFWSDAIGQSFMETWDALCAADDPPHLTYATNISETKGSDVEYRGRIDWYLAHSGLGFYLYPMIPPDDGLMFRRAFQNWQHVGPCTWEYRGFKWPQSSSGSYPQNTKMTVNPPTTPKFVLPIPLLLITLLPPTAFALTDSGGAVAGVGRKEKRRWQI